MKAMTNRNQTKSARPLLLMIVFVIACYIAAVAAMVLR